MAATRGTSGGGATTVVALAAIVLALCLLFFVGSTEACGGKRYRPCPKAPPTPSSPAPSGGKCPLDALKLAVCADVLGGGLTNLLVRVSTTARKPCCELVGGLADLDAIVCLCTAVKANVLGGGLTNLLVWVSTTAKKPCCELVGGLADLDATVCLCTAVKANVLGVVDLDLPVQLSLLVNRCGKKLPASFQCPN